MPVPPNPVPVNGSLLAQRQRGQKIRAAFVGSLLAWKGIGLFLKVAESLAGSEYEFRVYTREEPSQNWNNVTVFRDRPIEEIYAGMDVLIICSWGEEGFSLTALEAATYDIPVVFPDQPARCIKSIQ